MEKKKKRTNREKVSTKRRITPRRRTCTLLITYRCNLNCVYCYEHFKGNKKMTFEMAKSIVKKELDFVKNSPDYDELEIDFMGGEPFMEFSLIKKITEWLASEERPVPWICFASTNGTLLTPEIKYWMCHHKKMFVAGLSFDGTPDMQNINRTQSAKNVDIDFFMKLYPNQGVKMTISCDSVKDLAKGIIYLHKKGVPVSANCGYGMPWNNETFKIFQRELIKLAKYYLQHPEVTPISIFDKKFFSLGKEREHRKFCGTGTAMATYDVDGTLYPCHLFTPIVLGKNEAAEMQKRYDFNAESVYFDERCNGCCLENVCPTCYGFNYKMTGSISKRDPVMCELYRIQFDVAAWFHTELLKLKKKNGEEISEDEERNVQGIIYYFEHPPKSLTEIESKET